MTIGAAADALLLDSRVSRFDVQLHRSRPGGETYLIVGSDSRANLSARERQSLGTTRGARADIVMLVRVPADGSRPTLLSIPRDLLVLGADFGLHRLTLQWLTGPQPMLDTLCSSLGVGVDHVVVFDLSGFAKMVDAVGGVDVDIPYPIRDQVIGFSLDRGHHHLDGLTALQYVRARHLEEHTVFGWFSLANQRAEQSRNVLLDVGHKVRVGWNPVRMQRILWSGTGAVRIDARTGLKDLIRLARALRRIDPRADVELPAHLTDGVIPHAELLPSAGRALRTIGSGGPACARAAMPAARFH